MSFLTQRLANKFPAWTKLRKDPSSMGQRFFSVYAEYFEQVGADLVKLAEEFNLLKWGLGKPWIWIVQLDREDFLTTGITTGGGTTWTYPSSVVGEHPVLGPLVIERVNTLEELLWSSPTRLSLVDSFPVSTFSIWSSGTPEVFGDIAYPERLYISVLGSTDYFKKRQFKNKLASGRHLIRIHGKDASDSEFVEYVEVRDDGYYVTRNIFTEVLEVKMDGFNGDIEIFLPQATEWIIDPFRVAVSEINEGPMKIRLTQRPADVLGAASVLEFFTDIIKLGEIYRHDQGTADIVDNEDFIWSTTLRDELGAELSVVDICINFDDQRLYAVDTDGKIYVYDVKKTSFLPPSEEASITRDSFIDILPLYHFSNGGEMDMSTWFRNPRSFVVGVTIKRVTPTGTIEYLQSDKTTWAAGVFEFLGGLPVGGDNLPEKSWQDIRFTNIFDDYGQWEFYCTARIANGETSVSYTSVMVDKMDPVAAITTGIAGATSCYQSEAGQLAITDATTVYRFDIHSDVYIASEAQQQLVFREEYDSVEVTA
jgi:hypothetical protein